MRNILINLILSILPNTRFYKFKRSFLNILGIKVGSNTKITGNIRIYGKGKISIGDNVWIGIGCKFYITEGTEIYIFDNCDIAPDVVFHTGTHKIGSYLRRAGNGISESIYIRSGTWIGLRSTILAGVELKSGVIIGAGSTILKGSYISNSLVAGNPGVIKKVLPND